MEEELIELRQQNSLLLEQVKQIPVLQEISGQLSEQVKRLQEQIAKDSHNSSLPPSSDRFSRQRKSSSLRTRSGKKAGGQPDQDHSQVSQDRLILIFTLQVELLFFLGEWGTSYKHSILFSNG